MRLFPQDGFLAYYVPDLVLFVLGNGSAFGYDPQVIDKLSLFGQYLSLIEDKYMQFILKVVQLVRGEDLQEGNILMTYLEECFLFGLLGFLSLIYI